MSEATSQAGAAGAADVVAAPPQVLASGVGSWPGQEPIEAARVVLGELGPPHVPHLVELPGRGPGADLLGRGAAFLVDLPVDLQPSGWRLVDRPGRDLSRAQGYLRRDLDALAEVADGYTGRLKVQVAGPWTLAAALLLPRLERAVVDAGACRDLVASQAEGLARHVADVRRLVPRAQVVVQVDEPSLPAVLAGRLPTSSGFGRLRAIAEPVAVQGLTDVIDAARRAGAGEVVVHCCAADVPVAALVRAGVDGLSVDVGLLGRAGWEALAGPIEHGLAVWAGVVPTSGPVPSAAQAADAVRARWHELGLSAGLLLHGVVLTPTCGLAGCSPDDARARLTRATDAAAALTERVLG